MSEDIFWDILTRLLGASHNVDKQEHHIVVGDKLGQLPFAKVNILQKSKHQMHIPLLFYAKTT